MILFYHFIVFLETGYLFVCKSILFHISFLCFSNLYFNMYTQKTVVQKVNHFTIYNVLPSYIKIREEQRDFSSPVTLGVVGRLEKIKGGRFSDSGICTNKRKISGNSLTDSWRRFAESIYATASKRFTC